MNFSNPLNWFWLPPLAGSVLLLWLLRPRREEVAVPSLALWRALLSEVPANAPRQKLRRHLLLVLQLVTVFLLTLALARPFLYGHAPAGRVYVLVVDNAASMSATDSRPSRLDAAREAAAETLSRELRPQDTAVVLSTSPRARALCLVTGDKARLREALASAAPSDAPGDLGGALTLAETFAKPRTETRVRVFSDGVGGGASVPSFTGQTDVRQVLIGSPRPDNVAVTNLDAAPRPDGGYDVSVTVRHFGTMPRSGLLLSLSQDGRLSDARALTFTQGLDREDFRLPPLTAPAVVTARVDDLRDDLAADNAASLVLTPVHPTRLLLVSPGNLFLERGLMALPHVTVDECAPAQLARLRPKLPGYDALVLDGDFPAPTGSPGRYLTFNRISVPTPLLSTPQTESDAIFTGQDAAHPVLRFVDMSGVRVRTVRRLRLQPWGQGLVDSTSGPLIAAGTQGGTRVVSVGFDLQDSDWPLRVAFPLFLANSVGWLTQGAAVGSQAPQYAAGETATVTVPPGARIVRVVPPSGDARTVDAPLAGGPVTLGDTSQVGVYHVQAAGGAEYPVAVNLGSASASALIPRILPLGSGSEAPSAPEAWQVIHREWWPLAALLGLLLLGFEWWYYHRRA